jgi:uncharacterized protein (DUF4415 family)
MTRKMVRHDFDPADPPPLTEAQRAELVRLAAMRDEDIDLSDMPEKLDWTNAERGKFYRPVKQQLTLRLDADVVHWFKTQGGGYQTRINQALRDYVEAKARKTG